MGKIVDLAQSPDAQAWQKSLVDSYVAAAASIARSSADRLLRQAELAAESPIEHRLVATFLFELAKMEGGDYRWGFYDQLRPEVTLQRLREAAAIGAQMGGACYSFYVAVGPQCRISRYRADLAIVVHTTGDKQFAVAVECDGHDFHERTKEQAQRDKSRDREFQRLGLVVFRFTGAEIFRSATDCATEIMDLIFDRASESNG